MFDENRLRQIIREEVAAVLRVEASAFSSSTTELMTQAEAARYARVSTATIRNWQNAGLPFARRGRSVRYTRAALDRWMNRTTVMGDPSIDAIAAKMFRKTG